MNGYALHPEAFSDLEEIREYIAQDSPDAADRVITELFDTFDRLAFLPRQGYLRPDLTGRPLRFVVVREYLVAYADVEPLLWIIGVIHGRRNPRVMAAIFRGRE